MVAAAKSQNLMTAEEFYAWGQQFNPDEQRFVLVNGTPREMAVPDEAHYRATEAVFDILSSYTATRPDSAVVMGNSPLITRRDPDCVYRPDVHLFFSAERLGVPDAWEQPVHLPRLGVELPDLVVEVECPNDRYGPTTRAINAYLKRGVPLVWLVDPIDHTISVYTATEFHVLEEAEELTGNGVLPDFRCPVAAFFNWPGEAPAAGA